MKALWVIPLTLASGLILVCESAAQFGRPPVVPRFTPPPRINPAPRVVPPVPVTPRPSFREWRSQADDLPPLPNNSRDWGSLVDLPPLANDSLSFLDRTNAARAASSVGLLGSPWGQGPLLEASTLLDQEIRSGLPSRLLTMLDTSRATPKRTASMVALLASPLGQGPLLGASSPVVEETAAEKALSRLLAMPPHERELMLREEAPEKREQVNRSAAPVPIQPPVKDSDSFGWVFIVVVVGVGVVSLLAKALGNSQNSTVAQTRVHIVSVPPGEAPRQIREAWIGLELPVAGGPGQGGSQSVFGVLSQRMAGSCQGYAVNGAQAVQLLAAKDSEAAAWWHQNAPHVLVGGYQLIFPSSVCQEVG